MKIVTFFFARKTQYRTLLRIWEKSLKKTMPKVNYEIIRMETPVNIDHKRDTAFAFLAACKYALKSKESLAVCDSDLMFLKNITDIENKNFDLAITVRQGKMKYNTGLWFFKPTDKAKLFIAQWINFTEMLMEDFCKHEEFCWEYGGIDQASLYLTLRKNRGTKILELPCEEWNSTQSEWKNYNPNITRVIHIKSKLRSVLLKRKEIPEGHDYMVPLIALGRKYI